MKKILITLFLLCIVATGFKCNKGTPGIPEKDIFKGKLSNDKLFTTAAGATIASARDINPDFGPLVDGGLSDLFRIAAAPPNNYDVSSMSARLYRVWLIRRSTHCENPAFLVDATPYYEGSEWDKDPSPERSLICAAGMTIMQGNPITGAGMVITDDMGIMRTIVRYEGEHSLLFYLDAARYEATKYHDQGSGHPILGDGPPVEGFRLSVSSSKFQILTMKLPADIKDDTGSLVAPAGREFCVLATK